MIVTDSQFLSLGHGTWDKGTENPQLSTLNSQLSTYGKEQPEQSAVQLNAERLKLIEDISRLIMELKNQFPELAKILSKTRDNISAEQENIPTKKILNLLENIRQNMNAFADKSQLIERNALAEIIKNLVGETINLSNSAPKMPLENKLILMLSKNDFGSVAAVVFQMVSQATPSTAQASQVPAAPPQSPILPPSALPQPPMPVLQQPPLTLPPQPQSFQIIFNALQELKEFGIPRELQNVPLKELEAIVLQKTGIEIPRDLAKNLSAVFSEKPVFAELNLKQDKFSNFDKLRILPIHNQTSNMRIENSINTFGTFNTFEIPLPKNSPLQNLFANINISQNTIQNIPQNLPQKIELAFSLYRMLSPQNIPPSIPLSASSTPTPTPTPTHIPTTTPTPAHAHAHAPTHVPASIPAAASTHTPTQTQTLTSASIPISTSTPIQPSTTQSTPAAAPVSSPASAPVHASVPASTHIPISTAPLQAGTFILHPWTASMSIPKEERDFWLKTGLPLTSQLLNIRDTILSFGDLPKNPEPVKLFASALHELSLQTEQGTNISKDQENLLWRVITKLTQPPITNQQPSTINQQPSVANQQPPTINYQPPITSQQPPTNNYQPAAADQQLPTNNQPATANQQPPINNYQPATLNSQLLTLLKYQPFGNLEGDLFKNLPEPVKKELLQELPTGKVWQPEILQKAVEKVLTKYMEQQPNTANLSEHVSKTYEEVRNVLQNFKEQIQWTRIDQDTRLQNDRENIFYFMHNGELQKSRLKIKDERKGGSKKRQDSSISFSIETKTKNLGNVNADLILSKNILNIRMQDEVGTANEAVKAERETLAKELADIGISLGELFYGKTPKIQILPIAEKKEKIKGELDVRA